MGVFRRINFFAKSDPVLTLINFGGIGVLKQILET